MPAIVEIPTALDARFPVAIEVPTILDDWFVAGEFGPAAIPANKVAEAKYCKYSLPTKGDSIQNRS